MTASSSLLHEQVSPSTTLRSSPVFFDSDNGKALTNGSKPSTAVKEPMITTPQSSVVSRWFVRGLVRFILLDVPLLLVFCLYSTSMVWERFANDYLLPQMDLMKWTRERAYQEFTYYHRVCDTPDQSTLEAADLLVDTNMSAENATLKLLEHGAALFPHLVTPETAHQLRTFILQQNAKNQDMIYVLANENRWSFFLRVDQDPSVPKFLDELLNTNPLLVAALDRIAGDNPAVIEFTTITSAYGAAAQHWHQDVVPESNGAKYSRNFVPSYSLFIPLQDTTAGMGATGICPGTHMCADGCGEFCQETGFQLSKAFLNNETNDEYWPVGWGALVNQQTTHIGMPHTDPTAPHRVVLVITFAPRPRFGENQVETRIIGMGGSYSLHWSQWGHTLRDFANPNQLMSKPWRIFKSLGLYKPASADWGWDFMTQAAGRISNAEVGYFRDEFDAFLNQGGFFFLPKSWQGESPLEDIDDTETWIRFLSDTTHISQTKVWRMQLSLLIVYVVLCTLLFRRRGQSFPASVGASVVHLSVLYCLVAGTSWWAYSRMENRSWAANIRQGRSYNIPHAPHETLPDLPASLPRLEDVLIFDSMQSDYMESFTEVLEVAHPGNRAWNEFVEMHADGYRTLSLPLQTALRADVLQEFLGRRVRFLTKNQDSNWAPIDSNTADWLCHKQLLVKSDQFVNQAVKRIEFLLSETRFGYWRDTALHRRHIPELLNSLLARILQYPKPKAQTQTSSAPSASRRMAFTLPQLSLPPRTAHVKRNRTNIRTKTNLEAIDPEAWLREGDVVEACYEGRFEEWYRGVITFASSEQAKWDVEFDDGDLNENLCRECVRLFEPYRLDESVEVRVSDDTFAEGKVVAVSEDLESFDIELASGQVMKNSLVKEIRRVTNKRRRTFSRGEEVAALFPGEPRDAWFPGVIANVNDDGTYAVRYDDGDFEPTIRGQDIKLSSE